MRIGGSDCYSRGEVNDDGSGEGKIRVCEEKNQNRTTGASGAFSDQFAGKGPLKTRS